MQELTTPPPMMSPIGGERSPFATPMPSRIGPSIPSTTGGLPAQSGLSVYTNPLAEQLQSMGRGEDKMLVHMTPGEVQSLRGLAQLTGGDLTTNPNTGLPEAGWLGNLLPTLFGVLGAAVGIPTWALGLGGLVGGTAATGSLTKGLMMGLQSFGGAGLGNAVGLGGKISSNAFGLAGGAGGAAAPAAASAVAPSSLGGGLAAAPAAPAVASAPGSLGGGLANIGAAPSAVQSLVNAPLLGQAALPEAAQMLAQTGAEQVGTKAGLISKFSDATKVPLLGKYGPYAAGIGLLSAAMPSPKEVKPEEEKTNFPYKGAYTSRRERLSPTPVDINDPTTSYERKWFGPTKFYDRDGKEFIPGTPTDKPVPYYAKGGEMHMEEGSFIFPARETSEIGNGSSRAGQEVLARLGGKPIDGHGDGVSDSIHARIGGTQEARVARDEVYFSPQDVARIGGGSHERGTKKLYALMDKARNARKRAAIGADTKLSRGLG